MRFFVSRPLGVKPRIPDDILYISCNTDSTSDDELRLRRRQAVSVLLDTGAIEINTRGKDGKTVLEACYVPEILTLFIERGARVDTQIGSGDDAKNLLELAILDALQSEEGSYTARRLHAVERARLYSGLVTDSIRGRPAEKSVRRYCTLLIQEKRWNPDTCKTLASFIQATPGTFGD